MAKDIWQLIHPERDALAADLSGLSDDQWGRTSLCDRWTVRDTLAHMTATANMTPPRFFVAVASSGFRFQAFFDRGIRAWLGSSPQETLSLFRASTHRTTSPPGPGASWIGETVVHAEDIRRPLGISHSYNMDALRQVADFYSNSNVLIGTKTRIADVSLEATDTDWTHGTGLPVRGPMLSLLMAMTGRRSALDDLTGDGVDRLRVST